VSDAELRASVAKEIYHRFLETGNSMINIHYRHLADIKLALHVAPIDLFDAAFDESIIAVVLDCYTRFCQTREYVEFMTRHGKNMNFLPTL